MSDYDPTAVILAPPDPAWPRLFEAEKEWLEAAWRDAGAVAHHVGSTAIPGIAAKPVIDILVLLQRPLNAAEVQAAVARGYDYRGEYGIAGRQYFSIKAMPGYHIHAFRVGDPETLRMLNFRDYLCAHPEEARRYEELKRDLAARYPYDRAAYTDAKEDFIREVDVRAAEWRAAEA